MRRLRAIALSTLLLSALAPVGARGGHQGCDWPMYGHDLGRRFAQSAACSQITRANVATLRPKWFYPTPDSISASPSVVGGVVYVGSWDGTFYAFAADPPPGPVAPLWTFVIDDTNQVGFGRISSSAAVADLGETRVVVFGGGSTIYVLNASTGQKLTSECLDPRGDPAVRCTTSTADIEVLSSPAIVQEGGETFVVVGHSVHNRPNVGRTGVVKMRLTSSPSWDLQPLWKFDPERRLSYTTDKTKRNVLGFEYTADPLTQESGTGGGCGGVWSSPAVDQAAGLVFFGTANCTQSSAPAGETWGEAVWGISLTTGAYLWHHSPRGLNNVDDDFGASPNLLPGGLVGEGGKDAWYYAFSRTGAGEVLQPVWKRRSGQSGRLSSNFAIGGFIGSTAVGEVADEPAVFGATAIPTPFNGPVAGPQSVDGSLAGDPRRLFSLHAIRASDGAILWRSPVALPAYGAPTYARGIVFVPLTFTFSLQAYDADTGVLLWEHPLDGAPSSAPAVVGDSVYLGAGTREQDLEVLKPLSGVWAFELAGP